VNAATIRRNILTFLYDNSLQKTSIEASELTKALDLPLDGLIGHLDYLAQKELLRVHETSLPNGATYRFINITAAGTDLVDDPNEFNQRFPSQVIHQHIAGDLIDVEIGDNASQVVVGKDIINIDRASSFNLTQVATEYLNSFGETDPNFVCLTDELVRLQQAIGKRIIDLGEIQKIKNRLIELEGSPPVRTETLFSHPHIVQPVLKTVEELIGSSKHYDEEQK
jgi:hypothetical protein